jgi:endogenous inhibitor of DNA gyrase (YacG/DUF329 family)
VATVKCPGCGATVRWSDENRYRPFCSQRCKLIDLGAWATDRYAIPGSSTDRADEGTAEVTPPRDQ